MLKLVNLTTYEYDLERFDYNTKNISIFLENHNMNGIELLNPINWKENIIPKKMVKGIHLRYYPTWLDFWRNNKSELLRQFKNMDNIEKWYGKSREDIIKYYRRELDIANAIGAEYVVFHIGHAQLEHMFKCDFTYSDCVVIDAAAEIVNQVFTESSTKVKLLFENLWCPGLTMLDENMAWRLLEKVNYSNKGFILDTGHLMNTNPYIKDEKQGVEYLIDTINNLNGLKKFIKGIHLNCSLSGEYVRGQLKEDRQQLNGMDFNEICEAVYRHVSKVDLHRPFTDKSIKKLVDLIEPDYLVYEFLTSSIGEFDEYIKIQDEALK